MGLTKKIGLLTISFVLLSFYISNAQTGGVRGFVYEKSNGEPVIFTNVYLEDTPYGVATDVNGFFNITKVPEGKYTLMVSFLGYDTLKVPILIEKNKTVSQQLYLVKSSIVLQEFTVSAERQEMKTQIRTSVVKISPKQIEKIPTIGTEPDLAQYMQVVPGVVFTGDQGGQLYIRGGSPIQNKVLLDGMIIYNPFHSIGLFSVFDSDIIRNADIYTGGFNAKYGGRISSVMDITSRDGNKIRHGGKISGGPFSSKLLLEGPIKKQNTDLSGGTVSYILSGKTSYIDQSSKLLYSYIDTAGLPYNFTDLYGKLSINAKNGSKINLFGFNFSDNVKYRNVSDLNWDTYGLGTNLVLIPENSSALLKGNVAFSDYKIKLDELDGKPRESSINGFNMGLSFLYFLGKNQLEYGIETKGFATKFNFYNSMGRKLSQDQNTTELGAFMQVKLTFNKLLIEPGFRLHYYSSLGNVSPEPRIGLKFNATEKFRIKLAGGLYSQNLIAANSDRDVVNLFYGFLSGTDNLQDEFDGEEITHALQKSRHFILGAEYDLTNHLNLNIEGYIKDNTQLTSINRNKIYDDTQDNYNIDDYYKKDFIIETGKAYGVDALLKYDYKRLYFWFVYSLGYVDRFDGYMEYVPHYDRRHNINLVASYTFGKNFDWEVSGRWNLGSGFPFTQTQGYYEKIPFENGIGTDYLNSNGDLGIIYAQLNQGRLPTYHRFDLTVKKKWEFGAHGVVDAVFSVTNVYNRENIFYFDRVKYEQVNQLPIMPSLGVSLKF